MWSKAELSQLDLAFAVEGHIACATKAVELVAARGGTMTAADLVDALEYLGRDAEHTVQHLRGHVTTQGARVAALEADLAAARQALIREGVERDEACRKADEQRERAELAESALAAERNGDAQMKADFGALPGETLLGMVARIAKERDAATQLAAHRLKGRMDAAAEAERHRVERDAYRGRAEDAEARLQRMRDGISDMVKRRVEMAKVVGEPSARVGYEAGTGEIVSPMPEPTLYKRWSRRERYPCSSTCTHDDAATPGHPERVKERSEAFSGNIDDSITRDALMGDGFEKGAEAMRAACWEAVQNFLQREGLFDLSHGPAGGIKAAIEGATP